MGLTAEEAGGIQMLAASNGMTAKNVTNSIIKQTSALAKQTGIQLDNKQVVQDVAKVSGQLRLQYANNPKLIAKAVVETKKLGINMEIAANAAKGLLDFESSIENELSAELLTGKSLNLERARGLALNGDSVGAAKEMLAQVGSAADFQNMNVIQQEAIAKAVGMSTDDLANSLVTQENLKKLGDETRNQIEEKIKAAKALGTEEGDSLARQLEASIGSEKEAQKALEAVDAQQTFNQSIETLKSMLSSIVEGPAGDFAKFLSENVAAATTMLGLFIAIKGVLLASSLITAASILLAKKKSKIESDTAKKEIVGSSFKMASGAGLIGIALIAGLIGAGMTYLAMSGDDIMSPGGSGGGYGNRTLFGPEGAIQLNNKDTVIAGTNLFGNDIKSEPGKSTQMGSKGEIKVKSEGGDMSAVIAAINNLASRPINVKTSVQLDGKELATMQGKYPNEAGDANGQVAYQMS
jgi:hypothetical protein